MKKKYISIFSVTGITVLGLFNVGLNLNSHKLSDVSLANVEALASGESGVQKDCWDTITAAVAQYVDYCPVCDHPIPGKPSVFASKKKCTN
jgi:hypothetical protein